MRSKNNVSRKIKISYNLEKKYIYIRDEDTDVMNQCNYHKEIFQPKTLICMASPYQIGTNCTGLSLTPITIGNISKS